MIVPNIYNYLNYREFLADWYAAKKGENSSFSYQVLANRAGFKSKSFFPQVVDGSRNLSGESVFALSRIIGLKGKSFTYFELLVGFNQAKSNAQKDHFFRKIIAVQSPVSSTLLLRDRYEFFSHWYHSTIREVITWYDWDEDYRKLARMVRPSITPFQARQSVKLLQKLKLIQKKGCRWVQTEPDLTTGDTVQSLAVEKFHLQNLNLAGEAIDSVPASQRDISLLVAGLSQQTYETVKQEIVDFRKRLISIISSEKKPERVYHLSMQLIPTSNPVARGAAKRRTVNGADFRYSDTTDTAGRFSFVVPGGNTYNLTALTDTYRTALFYDSITVSTDAIDLGTLAPQPADSIVVTVAPKGFTGGHLVVPGSSIALSISSAGDHTLAVPDGIVTVHYRDNNDTGAVVLNAHHTVSAPVTPDLLGERTIDTPILFRSGGAKSTYHHPLQYRFATCNAPFDWNAPDSVTSWHADSTMTFTFATAEKHKVRTQARSVIDTTVISPWSAYLSFDILP